MILILQESAHVAAERAGPAIEGLVTQIVMWLKLGVEAFGGLIIAIGALIAVFQVVRAFASPRPAAYYEIRLRLSRFLALALEFQLAADILGTAISPSWDQLGKLGAVALLRTALNYFLEREIKEEEDGFASELTRASAVANSAAENAAS